MGGKTFWLKTSIGTQPLKRERSISAGWATVRPGVDVGRVEAAFHEELARLHPKNLRVRDKIPQQLQRLRDFGFHQFLGGGMYRVKTQRRPLGRHLDFKNLPA